MKKSLSGGRSSNIFFALTLSDWRWRVMAAAAAAAPRGPRARPPGGGPASRLAPLDRTSSAILRALGGRVHRCSCCDIAR
eukprot:COSAG01_NODE_202_length_22130_cov_167.927239_15_plen_80_part_00